jgi:hypothetical protein
MNDTTEDTTRQCDLVGAQFTPRTILRHKVTAAVPVPQPRADLEFVDGLFDSRFFVRRFDTPEQGGRRSFM